MFVIRKSRSKSVIEEVLGAKFDEVICSDGWTAYTQYKLKLEMGQIIEQMNAYREFREFANKVKNGLEHWFTCLIHLFVEPTNNNAERALRELVVQRKIMGGLRREKGAHIMEVIASMIATIKKRELPVFQTLRSYL